MSQPYAQSLPDASAPEPAPGEVAEPAPLEPSEFAGPTSQEGAQHLPVAVPGRSLVTNPAGSLVAAAKGIDWRAHAPRWTAAVLAGVVAAEAVQMAWVLHGIATEPVPAPLGPLRPPPRSFHWWRLADAHLFGRAPRVARTDPAHPAAQPMMWALSGVMAMSDPTSGIAILGERGKPLNVYHTGAALKEVAGGRLYEVFADHVVLDLPGGKKTLTLPKDHPQAQPQMMTALPSQPWQEAAGFHIRRPLMPPTAAAALIASLNPEPDAVNGVMTGMKLHPRGRLRRLYDLRDGDVLIAINGNDVTDPAVMASVLEQPADSLSLTYLRDGVEQTVNIPLDR